MGWSDTAILNALRAALVTFGVSHAAAGLAYPVPVDFGGKLVRWKIDSADTPVYFETVNDSTLADATALAMVQESAALWSSVNGSLLRLSEVTDPVVNPASITVHFKSDFDGGSFAAAYASFDSTAENGDPLHCTVKVAIRGTESSSDLEKTVLHEFGHCLGLGHSLFPRAIMSYRLEQNAFQLDVDDQAALRGLYPEDGNGASLPPGCTIGQADARPFRGSMGGSRNNPQHHVSIDLFWMAMLLIPAIARLTKSLLRG